MEKVAEIDGYKVVPLRLTPDAKHCHSIYIREHFIRLMDPNKPKGRTLFLLNIPPYVTEVSLWKCFKEIGVVNAVAFAAKPGREESNKWRHNCTSFSNTEPPFTFKVAYVVFKDSISVARALEITSIDLFSKGAGGESYVESGMQLWHSQYVRRMLNEEEVQARIDRHMAAYDQRERSAQDAAKTSAADPDGWVTVGTQGRNAGFEQKETVIGRLEEKMSRSKKKKELSNFYTFQIREAKMKNIIDLRQKFEEDKRKIEVMKQTRRFRPF